MDALKVLHYQIKILTKTKLREPLPSHNQDRKQEENQDSQEA